MTVIAAMPDFKALYPLVRLACEGAYERDVNKCHDLVTSYGMEFKKVIGNGECFITAAMWNGDLVLGIRGTQFTDGFSLAQVLDNERFEKVEAKDVPGFAMDGYASPLWSLLENSSIPWTPRTWICGHSMGGIRTLLSTVKVPDNVKLQRIALAPPCGMNSAMRDFLNTKFGAPIIVGREKDFALNHPILAPQFTQGSPILHLEEKGPSFIEKWPFWDESVEDHMPERYLGDWEKLM